MKQNTGWKWDKVNTPFWIVPSEDVYYFIHRWKERNLTRLLDLGCGLGRHALLFAEHGFQVTGYDLSNEGLAQLKKTAEERKLSLSVMAGDVASLPFADGAFDAVLAYHSIYHVDTAGMKKAISELRRVLKPGGEAYLTLLSKNASSYTADECPMVDENVRLKEEEEGSVLPHYFVNHQDIPALFNGFEILKVRQVEDIYDGNSSWHYFLHVAR
jgi:SAM-dependent methyltransferase